MQSTNYAYVNGRFVPESEATVSIFDRGFLYGDGVFETMRVYGGKIFRLYNHLQRLLAGLKAVHIGRQLTQEDIRAALLELVDRNQVRSGMVRIYVTGGINRWGVKRQAPGEPTIVATTQELPARPGDLRAVISSIRLDAASKLAGIKSGNRLLYVLAQDEAELKGFGDAVLLNGAGHVVELTTSNVCVVKNDALFTPPLSDGPLPGITRAAVLTIAAELGIAVHETSFGAEMFSQADDVFATNSLIEIEPVWEVDGAKFREHQVTRRLRDAYRKLVAEELAQG